MPCIHAVVVNQNTSIFTELMIQTLIRSDNLSELGFHLTVIDNDSSDRCLDNLKATVAANGWSWLQSGFDSTLSVDKHAAALQMFFEQCSSNEWILLLDADVWFPEKHTIKTLIETLEAHTKAFACHPMIFSLPEQTVAEGISRIPGATPHDDSHWIQTLDGNEYTVSRQPRCTPICCLIRLDAVIKKVLSSFGSYRAHIYQLGKAYFYDTLALTTKILATHGYTYCVSRNTVCHFVGVLSDQSQNKEKTELCRLLLEKLDSGISIENLNETVREYVSLLSQE
jgi:hypothetical protein